MNNISTNESVNVYAENQQAPIADQIDTVNHNLSEENTPAEEPSLSASTAEEKAVELRENIAKLQKQLAEIEQPIVQEEKNKKEVYEPIILSDRKWQAQYEYTVGLKHRKPIPPQPCQDSAFAMAETEHSPFSVVISADGAGSRPISDIGSQRVVSGIYRLIHTLYRSQFNPLDEGAEISSETAKRWALILTKHAKGLLEDLGSEYRRSSEDFCCTLLVGLVGKYHTFWFKVGDGAIVKETAERNTEGQIEYKLTTLGEVGKGEYANETTFISNNLAQNAVQSGVFTSSNLSALFTMSDGAAQRLVSNDGQNVSARLTSFSEELRNDKLDRLKLTKLFYSEEFLDNHDGDDCSIALISR